MAVFFWSQRFYGEVIARAKIGAEMGCDMGDMTVGVILMLVTGFLWVTGAILHWHNLRRQERLLGRMRRMTAPRGRGPYRELARAAARPVAADGFRSGPLTH